MSNNILAVKHNIEVAHRLSLLDGKCENIHGHSMIVQLELVGGEIDEKGLFAGMDFALIKKAFRGYLDGTYDHRLLLNKDDPWAQKFHPGITTAQDEELPGLQPCEGDPTTENIALWIANWAHHYFIPGPRLRDGEDLDQEVVPVTFDLAAPKYVSVTVWETQTNMAQVIL